MIVIELLLSVLLMIVVIAAIMYLFLRKGSQSQTTSYRVVFKGTSVPNLNQNAAISSMATIVKSFNDGYLVRSKINDTKLRELIMSQYHLSPGNVIIVSPKPAFILTAR